MDWTHHQLWIALGVALFLGAVLSGVITWLIASRTRARLEFELQTEKDHVLIRERDLNRYSEEIDTLEHEKGELLTQRGDLQARVATLQANYEHEVQAGREKLELIENAQARLTDSFKALSSEALRNNQESFLSLARTSMERYQEAAKGDLDKRQETIKQVVEPVQESLEKMNARIQDIEKAREGAYSSLKEQIFMMGETQKALRQETGQLVKALREPVARGQWGELQLRKVVELAGMMEYCDFSTQESVTTDENRELRPDLVVRLPGDTVIIVDAKTPLSAYLDAANATTDEEREICLLKHSKLVRAQVKLLARKEYQKQFERTPEFVVLFLPGEHLFSAALAQDPSLMEDSIDQNVLLANPMTLIALLKAVAYGWRQESLARNAQKISLLGQRLYERITKLNVHLTRLGKNINQSVSSYNDLVGNLERRVLSTARDFQNLKAIPESKDFEVPPQIESGVRSLQSEEMTAPIPKSSSRGKKADEEETLL